MQRVYKLLLLQIVNSQIQKNYFFLLSVKSIILLSCTTQNISRALRVK